MAASSSRRVPLFACVVAVIFTLVHSTSGASSIVTFGCARFTILTEALVRLETSKNSTCPSAPGNKYWDDRLTFTVINRNLATPNFTVSHPSTSSIQNVTDKLNILYIASQPTFTSTTLRIVLLDSKVIWRPQADGSPGSDPLNLNGTLDRSPPFTDSGGLDCYTTPEQCVEEYRQLYSPGLLSRSG